MSITNLLLKTDPKKIPEFMRGQFYELSKKYILPDGQKEYGYVGWVHIREDGTIEFGEPGA